jgi:diaminopropionate ammonia-lyase
LGAVLFCRPFRRQKDENVTTSGNQLNQPGPSFVLNPASRKTAFPFTFLDPAEQENVVEYFRSRPDYQPTPLRTLRGYAEQHGIAEVLVKDETARLGLPAFKILGVAYAVHRLTEQAIIRRDSVLACATAGNHGRAVARVARQNNLKARIYIPAGASQSRVQAIAAEGAEITIIQGSYDDAVITMARDADTHGWLVISDTAWPGYETVPRLIMAGYTMMMIEAEESWHAPPDLVIVQAGVGGLAGSVTGWLLQRYGADRPSIVCCEPHEAACVFASIAAGELRESTGSLQTIMGGLNCARISTVAWPLLRSGVDACVSVSDDAAIDAVRKLAYPFPGDPRILAGESGACGVAALSLLFLHPESAPLRESLKLNRKSRVLAIITEGIHQSDGAKV